MAYFAKKAGLKTQFDIDSEKERPGEQTLLIELGKTHCHTAYLHKSTHSIDRIQIFSVDEFTAVEEVKELIGSLKHRFESTVVCSAFPQALLFPTRFFNNTYAVFDAVYDEPAQVHLHDNIPEWQMVNLYSLPERMDALFQESFSSVQYLHTYTPSIKIYNGYVGGDQLSVHFTEQYFRVLLKKDSHVHLAQTYFYKTPLDVVYYLLKICSEFHLAQADVYLILSGFVDKQSNLFSELQQYFRHIGFLPQPEIALPASEHPHYYFASLYNLAACVL